MFKTLTAAALVAASADAGVWKDTFMVVEDLMMWYAGYIYGLSGYTPRLVNTEHCFEAVADFYSSFQSGITNCQDDNTLKCMTDFKHAWDVLSFEISNTCPYISQEVGDVSPFVVDDPMAFGRASINWFRHKDEIKQAIHYESELLHSQMYFKAGVQAAVIIDMTFGVDASGF